MGTTQTTAEERRGLLEELRLFSEKCEKQLEDIVESLGWSPEHKGAAQEAMVQCPFDPNHRVPVRSLERHKASCSLSKMGYTAEDQAAMYDSSVCYEKSNIRRVTMDKSTQQQVILQARAAAPLMRMEGVFWQGEYTSQPVDVPQNHQRALCDLTVADRLALYDHVTGELNQPDQAAANEDLYVDLVAKLKRDEALGEPKSHLEKMAEMRDYKRRRQSYRAKNVHITKKSYTEVIREVIQVHSGELSRQWKEEGVCEEEEATAVVEEEERGSVRSSQRRRSDDEERPTSRERPASHGGSRQRSSKHSQDREDRKRKRKKRDSNSPDEHHERKKKKKKKKKDEKEK